jgi:hypothetical protein
VLGPSRSIRCLKKSSTKLSSPSLAFLDSPNPWLGSKTVSSLTGSPCSVSDLVGFVRRSKGGRGRWECGLYLSEALHGLYALCAPGLAAWAPPRDHRPLGAPVDAHVPELADAGERGHILLGQPVEVTRFLLGPCTPQKLEGPLGLGIVIPLVPSRPVVWDVHVSTSVAELPFQDPALRWRLVAGFQGHSSRSTGSHPACDSVDGLDKVHLGPVCVTASRAREHREHFCEVQKACADDTTHLVGGRAGGLFGIRKTQTWHRLTGWRGRCPQRCSRPARPSGPQPPRPHYG